MTKEVKKIDSFVERLPKPEFNDIYGLRKYAESILNIAEQRKKLDPRGLFNNERKVSLDLGFDDGKLISRIEVGESKNKETISITIKWQSLTEKINITDEYKIIGKSPEDPIEDELYFYHTGYNSRERFVLSNSPECSYACGKLKGLFSRAVEHNSL